MIKYANDIEMTPRATSTADGTLAQIEVALKCLAEAVDRIGVKTSSVRYPVPCNTNCETEVGMGASPLISRLIEIKNDIQGHAAILNNLSDEIQL